MNPVIATSNNTIPATTPPASETELSATEVKFLKRIAGKYGNPKRKPLLQSLLIFTAMIVAAHLIERTSLPAWSTFLIVYFPAVFLFSRYRRFGVFKSKLMRKLALREAKREQEEGRVANG